MKDAMKPVAIPLGDPAGIGPEIVAKAFAQQPRLLQGCFAVGDLACLRRGTAIAAGEGPSLAIARIEDLAEAADVPPRCIPLLQAGPARGEPPPLGQVSAAAGRLAADAVVWAARAALRGDIAALVTAPLHKEALSAAGVPFPG